MMESIFLRLVCIIPLIGHPLTLGFLILSVSSLARIILCKLVASWFGYSLFLVYVGGVLVIFSYVVALSPNLRGFNLNYFSVLGLSLLCINLVLVYVLDLNLYWDFFTQSPSGGKRLWTIASLFDYRNIILMMFLLIMLLATIVIVAKICYYRSGPLRPFN